MAEIDARFNFVASLSETEGTGKAGSDGTDNEKGTVTALPPRAPNPPTERLSREAYSGVLDKVLESVLEENHEIESQRISAPQLFKELADLEPARRRLVIHNTSKYKAWPLAEHLLAECRGSWTEDPRRAEEYACVALEVVDTFQCSGFRECLLHDLKAQAWSQIGNCRRIYSDLHASHSAFHTAESHLDRGSGDSVERARLLDLKASLLAEQRDYEGAKNLLLAVIEVYREAKEQHLEGRALVKLAKFLRESGRVEDAIPAMERAGRLLDPALEPSLTFVVQKNLVSCLTDLGRTEEAQKLLPEVRELARTYGTRLERLRLLWTEAMLRRSLGQSELAETALRQAREGFIAAEIGYDAALISLDLAALYFEQGRTREVRRLALEAIPIFASRSIQRELVVAWQLFREAAERDVVSLGLINELSTRIRNADSGFDAGH